MNPILVTNNSVELSGAGCNKSLRTLSAGVLASTTNIFISFDEIKSTPQSHIKAPQEIGNYTVAFTCSEFDGKYIISTIGSTNSFNTYYDRNDPKEMAAQEQTGPHRLRLFNSVKNFSYIKNQDSLEPYFQTTIEMIRNLAALPENWDSYNAKKISWHAIVEGLIFFNKFSAFPREINKNIPEPFIAPLPSGGIQVEWETLVRKLHFRIPASSEKNIEYLKIEKSSTIPGIARNIEEIFSLVKDWLFNIA